MLDLDPGSISGDGKEAAAAKLELGRKREFHLTAIGSATGEAIKADLLARDEKERLRLFGAVADLARTWVWTARPQDDFYLIRKTYEGSEVRTSIIQKVALDGLAEFYGRLNALLGTSFEVPMPHLTLYTGSTNPEKALRGIGLYSEKEFLDLGPEKV